MKATFLKTRDRQSTQRLTGEARRPVAHARSVAPENRLSEEVASVSRTAIDSSAVVASQLRHRVALDLRARRCIHRLLGP